MVLRRVYVRTTTPTTCFVQTQKKRAIDPTKSSRGPPPYWRQRPHEWRRLRVGEVERPRNKRAQGRTPSSNRSDRACAHPTYLSQKGRSTERWFTRITRGGFFSRLRVLTGAGDAAQRGVSILAAARRVCAHPVGRMLGGVRLWARLPGGVPPLPPSVDASVENDRRSSRMRVKQRSVE